MSKVVLAYSGGLDTSVILKWLIEKGYEVTALIVDLGQKEDLDRARSKALKVGAKSAQVVDAKKAFVTEFMYPALRASAMYEGRYLMGTSLARPLIARHLVEAADEVGAEYVAHGATGKGNDQVRFELGAYALKPSIKVIAPWKMPEFLAAFKGRQDLLDYAGRHDIEVEATKAKPYSMDANLMHISYEAGVLEDPAAAAPDGMFRLTKDIRDTPNKPCPVEVTFDRGSPIRVAVDGVTADDPVKVIEVLNEAGGEHGIGRIDIVENRFVGMKSRGVYETPGYTILWKAHQDLELLALDKEVFRIKEGLAAKFADLAYNGFWFSPEMEYLRSCLDKAQERVSGSVQLELFKGNVIVKGRSSPYSLYDKHLASMDEEGGYNQADAHGFIRINAVRLKTYAAAKKVQGK